MPQNGTRNNHEASNSYKDWQQGGKKKTCKLYRDMEEHDQRHNPDSRLLDLQS